MSGASVKIVETLDSDRAAFAWQHPYIDRARSVTKVSENIVKAYERREIFAFSSEDTGPIQFDVRGIKDAMASDKLKFVMLEAELNSAWVEHIRANGGVEAEHMGRLTAADLERPGIAVWWGNDYTTIIDGNNRLVRRWDDGLRTFRFARIADRRMRRYVCRPGEEERFFDARPIEGATTLSKKVTVR